MLRGKFTILFSCLLVSVSVQSRADSLGFNDLVKLTLKQNDSRLSQLESGKAARATWKQSFAAFSPTFGFFANHTEVTKDSLVLGQAFESETDSKSWGYEVNWNLFNGLQDWHDLKSAKELERQEIEELKQIDQSLYNSLRQAWIQVIVAQKNLSLTNRVLKRQRQNLKFIKLKYDSGREPRWSYLKSKSDLDLLRASKVDQEATLYQAKKTLEQLTRENFESISFKDNKNDIDEYLVDTKFEVSDAVAAHPDYKVADQTYKVSDLAVRKTWGEYAPSLDLSYTFTRTDTQNVDPDLDDRTLSLTLTIPVFTGLSTYHGLEKARMDKEAALYSKRAVQIQVKTNLEGQLQNFKAKLAKLPASRSVLRAARERKKIVTKQYRSGLKSFLEWEQAESKLIEAEQDEITILSEALLAKASLENALGKQLVIGE